MSSGHCPKCGKEVIWGVTTTGSKIALSPHATRRYYFLFSPPRSTCEEVETYQQHDPECERKIMK